jgi:DNA modification methylase
VIERCAVLWSNPEETMLTPFMGVGSEVCGALANGRRGVGIELKPSYFRQAIKNVAHCSVNGWNDDGQEQFSFEVESAEEPEMD